MNTENDDIIICPICKKSYKTLTSHINRIHKLSFKEFKKLYPHITTLFSKNMLIKYSNTSKILGFGKGNKNKKLSEEHRKKLSELSSGKNNHFYGKKHTNKSKEIMSKNHADFTGLNNPLTRWLNKDSTHRLKYKNIIKDTWDRRKLDIDRYNIFCKDVSDRVSKLFIDGKLLVYGKNHKHGYFKSIKQNIEIYYRSSYEEKVLLFCEEQLGNKIIKYDSVNFRISYIDTIGKNRYYIPDLIINDKLILEIKPISMLNYGDNQLKFKALDEYSKRLGLEYLIITEKELENLNIILEKI